MSRALRDKSILMICDIQNKFNPLCYGREGFEQSAVIAVKIAKILQIPIIVTEHNPKIFGTLIPELKQLLHYHKFHSFQKYKFSMIIPEVQQTLKHYKNRNQIILIGAQTHICILQTFLDLKSQNYEVFLAADAITSMRSWERTIALQRLGLEGGIVTTIENITLDMYEDDKYDPKYEKTFQIFDADVTRKGAIDHL